MREIDDLLKRRPGLGTLYLSPHTIRTRAEPVNRRLGVTTRSQAVAQARRPGLLEG